MEEVSGEEQALLAVKLHANVRELIRAEVKAYLSDYLSGTELGQIMSGTLVTTLSNRLAVEPQFTEATRMALKRILERY